MWIQTGNIYSRFVRGLVSEQNWLREFLTFAELKFDRKTAPGEPRDKRPRIAETCLLNKANNTFPSGLIRKILDQGIKDKMSIQLIDKRNKPCGPDTSANIDWLHDYQEDAVDACVKRGRGILWMPTGCHRAGQEVLMYSGALRKVEDVEVGERLMGPDSTPREVLGLCRGTGEMVRVSPSKGGAFVVNLDHILTLQRCAKVGDVVDVSVREWRTWAGHKKNEYKMMRTGVEFQEDGEGLPIDPYFLGVLLGCGSLQEDAVSMRTQEPVAWSCAGLQAPKFGCYVCLETGEFKPSSLGGQANRLTEALRGLDMLGCPIGEKEIPIEYTWASRESRLALIAGLIDVRGSMSGGKGFDFTAKSQALAKGLAFLCRSVGLAAYITPSYREAREGNIGVYFRVSISGDCSVVPTRVVSKKAAKREQVKSVLRTGFTVELLPQLEQYFGFQLDLDRRYLLGDFTVTHNSGKGEIVTALTRALPCNWLFVVHRSGLMYDIASRYEARARGEYPGAPAPDEHEDNFSLGHHRMKSGLIGNGLWDPAEPGEGTLTCATFQSLSAALGSEKFLAFAKNIDGVIIDEAHTLPADSFWRVAMSLSEAYYRFGLSGTPLARGDKKSVYTIAATGPVIYRIKTSTLVERGVLARPKIKMIRCEQESEKPTWQGVYGEKIVRSVKRNKLVVDAARKAPKPCLVFVKEVKHGKYLKERLEKAGVNTAFVWGDHAQSIRDRAVKDLVRGDTDVLVCSVVFQEGLDVPELESIVIASGGKSIIATLQRIGRGMRSNQGKKKTFEVVDFLDEGNKFLKKHAKARRKAYLAESHEVTVVRRP